MSDERLPGATSKWEEEGVEDGRRKKKKRKKKETIGIMDEKSCSTAISWRKLGKVS